MTQTQKHYFIPRLLVLLMLGFARAHAASLLLDFGLTTTESPDDINSPAHAAGAVPLSEVSWNTITSDTDALVYSDGSTATGITLDIGRSLVNVHTIEFTDNGFSVSALGGQINTGVYAGTSPVRDGIFGGSGGANNLSLGLRVDGLPDGTYAVYFTGRNTSAAATQGMLFYITNAASASAFSFDTNTTPNTTVANIGSASFAEGGNYGKVIVILSAGQSLYIASEGIAVTERRGFFNTVEIVPGTGAPEIGTQPSPEILYNGRTARFTVSATGIVPLSYRWRKGGTPLNNGGNVSGATNSTLTLANISATDEADYDVVVSNSVSSATSTAAHLTVIAINSVYEGAVLANNPLSYFRFSETNDSATAPVAYDNAGGFNGIYGIESLNGFYDTSGPTNSDFPGFASTNPATLFTSGAPQSRVTARPWNLTTNSMTFLAWINPSSSLQGSHAGLVFARGGNVAGFNYSHGVDANGNTALSYTWNNELETFNWNSGISAPANQWSLVALVVTPTNATVYVVNTNNGPITSTFVHNHIPQNFNAEAVIGCDHINAVERSFGGTIDEVAVFTGALSAGQINALFTAASGFSNFPPVIVVQPPGAPTLYEKQTAQFAAVVGGSDPLAYQWQKGTNSVYVNVANDGRISGANSATLTIANLNLSDAADYQLVVTNAIDSAISSLTTLTVTPLPILNISYSGGNVQLDWSIGVLLEATNILGPWITNGAPSPATIPPTESQRYFKLRVE